MEDFKIVIPKPCHENWDKMSSNQQGKHCGVCDKTVVDFTKMELEEIQHYFKTQKSKICGRFSENHVSPYIPKYQQWLMDWCGKIETKFSFSPFKKLAMTFVALPMFIVGCYKKSNNLMTQLHPHEINAPDSTLRKLVGEVELINTDSTKSLKSDSVCVKKTVTLGMPIPPKK